MFVFDIIISLKKIKKSIDKLIFICYSSIIEKRGDNKYEKRIMVQQKKQSQIFIST